MGATWDADVPSVDIWKECCRVLKPGAFMFVMSAPRLDVQSEMAKRIEEGGFKISFSPIYWCYAQGFNKSANMSKSIDRKFGLEREVIGETEHPGRKDRSYVTNSNVFSGDRKGDILEERIPEFDEHINTKNTRQNPYHSNKNMIKIPHTKTLLQAIANQSDEKPKIKKLPLTKPACEESMQAQGAYAGFQPKPAVEVILVCMKPLSEKGYRDQFLENEHGVVWFDDCRIPYAEFQEALKANSKGYATQTDSGIYGWNSGEGLDSEFWQTEEGKALKKKLVGGRLKQESRYTFADKKLDGYKPQDIDIVEPNLKGRFPANLLVSDNALDIGLETKSTGGTNPTSHLKEFYGMGFSGLASVPSKGGYGDVGDLSRYFSLDLWYEEHLPNIPKEQQRIFPFLYVPKPSNKEKNDGLNMFEEQQVTDGSIRTNPETARIFGANHTFHKNKHPTVKPLKLFQYLIILGSRPNDIILDPFAGSGTTIVAAKLEDRRYIGIELMDDEKHPYFSIMKARVESMKTQKKLENFIVKKDG